MSKKVDHPELRAQFEALNNKELHNKCVEYGMNVPVADSTRDVIIRKLIKSITGDANVASPKATKKKQQPSTPNERRKTVNVTVHVSSDEEEAAQRQNRTQATKTRTRTQSPKGHNVTFDTTLNNNRRTTASANAAASPILTIKQQQQQSKQRIDANANAGVGLSNSSRILPLEVDWTEKDDYNIDVRRNDGAKDVNLNRGYNSGGMYNSTPMQVEQTLSSYQGANLGYNNYQSASPNLSYSQTRNTTYQQDEQNTSRPGFLNTTPESTYNRTSYGYYSPGMPPTIFNAENKASHSSTMGSQYASGSSPPKAQESIFKRPVALSKSNITNTSYNQADAQRLYPRLPTDLPSPPSYSSTSPPSSPESEESSNRSNRAPSLTKSGVMTTSYYQEISPAKEVKHYEVESGDEPAFVDGGAGDYERRQINTALGATSYERSSYLTGLQRDSATQHLPFEPHLQSTLHDTLDAAAPRYVSSPLSRQSYVPRAATAAQKPSSPIPAVKRYSATSSSNTSYTRSIDEPDSGSDAEKLSGDEIYVHDSEDDEEYMPGNKKIYSSFGSNKIQERLPYRRSNASRLSSSPNAALYNHSPVGRPLINTVGGAHAYDEDDDDVNTSLRNFITTLDRKYHIKQMLYMFAIFAAAVFVYVIFIEKTPAEDDVFVATTKMHP